MEDLSKLKAFFLNLDVKPMMAGIEMSALNRTKIFCDILKIDTTVLTVGFNNSLRSHVNHAITNNRASKKAQVLGMYEDLLDASTYPEKKVYISDLKSTKNVDVDNSKTDFRMYDSVGNFVGFGRRHDDLTLSYINFFKNGKVHRRETYDSRGFVSRTEIMQPKADKEDSLVDIFSRPNGSQAVIKIGSIKNNSATIDSIVLVDNKNQYVSTFEKESSLINYWIDNIANRNEKILFVVDRCNELFIPALNAKIKYPEKVKLVAVIHGVHTGGDVFAGPSNAWYRSALENLEKLDAMVVLTEHQKKDILQRYTHAINKVHVIPHACEKTLPIVGLDKRDNKKIVYVARFSPEKRHVLALEIFSEVLKKVPDAKLHFYGFGQTEKDIKAKIEELGIKKSVELHPYDQNIAEIYKTAGLSILTSDVEGFCMSVLESLSFDCPVVSFNIKYGPESMIVDGENGALIPLKDNKKYADAIVKILKDKEFHSKLITGCDKHIKKYHAQNISDLWKKVLCSIG